MLRQLLPHHRFDRDLRGPSFRYSGHAIIGFILAATLLSLQANDGPGSVERATKISGGPVVSDGDNFGYSLANIGDLDGDGFSDLAVGSRQAIHIFRMDGDSSVIANLKIAEGTVGGLPAGTLEDGDFFGRSIANLGDLDGNGVNDLAVGAVNSDNLRGAVHILFMASNGSVINTTRIADGMSGLPTNTLADGDRFGVSVANLGDLDGDGVNDLAVGAHFDGTGGTERGAVYVLFLNANGTVKSRSKIADGVPGGLTASTLMNGDRFGYSLANLGDLDWDGVPDLAVGAYFDNTGGDKRGALHILFLNADGTVKGKNKIADGLNGVPGNTLVNSDHFGSSVANLGDLDGDGIPDLAVGARGDDTGGSGTGAIYIVFLQADGTARTDRLPRKITDGDWLPAMTLSAGDNLGISVTSLGDLDGDTMIDIVVGAIGDDSSGTNRGAIHTLELGDPPLTVTTLVDELNTPSTGSGGTGLSLREALRDAEAEGDFCTINFAPGLAGQTITLGITLRNLHIPSGQSVKVTAAGLDGGVSISAGGGFPVIFCQSSVNLVLESLTIRDGYRDNGGGGGIYIDRGGGLNLIDVTVTENTALSGGGVLCNSYGILMVSGCTFSNNTATSGDGGGIFTGGTANFINNSTFFGNESQNIGGAMAFLVGSPQLLRHVTVSGNTAISSGGGLYRFGSEVTVDNSIISGNTAPTKPDVSGSSITEIGNNLIGGVANLGPLADNGGKTMTMKPLPGSPAIDGAVFIPLPDTDQRGAGFRRKLGSAPDIGAFETAVVPPVTTALTALGSNAAAKAALSNKIKKLKKKIKSAKKKGQKSKAKRLGKKLKKLLQQLAAL